MTPMLVVMLAIGTTDVLFALDSIPAIFGLTQDPYIVFTANAFALMGLRQLYFLIGGLLKKLVHLSLRPVGHPRLHRREAGAARAARVRRATSRRSASRSPSASSCAVLVVTTITSLRASKKQGRDGGDGEQERVA